MKVFTIFGDLILKMFDLVGALILEIPNIPNRLREINTENLKDRIDTDKIRENVSKIKDTGLEISETGISKLSKTESAEIFIINKKKEIKDSEVHEFETSEQFTSEEKEKTVFKLQIISGTFLVLSMLYLFNFLSIILYGILGFLSILYILYVLFSKIKLMYTDFNAYRDFF